ncbi:MAG: hypothetical protein V1494_07080 [Candidatus Diapherotrites archaeon]
MRQVLETTRMSTRGQVVIPKDAREFTNSKEDTIFTVFPVDRKTIVLKKIDSQKIVSEFRALRAKVKNKISEAEVNEITHKTR